MATKTKTRKQPSNARQPRGKAEPTKWTDILSSEKTDFVIGVLVMALAILLVISMVSYLYTASADQSLVEDLRPGEWMNVERAFANRCGSGGALVAYWLVSVCFGLPALLIPVFLAMVSLRLMGAYRVNLWKWFLGLSVTMVWSSVTLAKFLTPFMGDQVYNPGGDHGLFCVQRIEAVVGTPGLTALIVVVALVFLTCISAETIKFVRRMLNPIGFLMNRIKFTVTTQPTETSDVAVVTPHSEEDNDTDDETVIETPEPTVVDLTPMPTETEKPADKPADPAAAPVTDNLTVEVAKGEEAAKGKRMASSVDNLTPIDPREPFTRYQLPPLSLLKTYADDGKPDVDMEEIKTNNAHIVKVLNSFGVTIREIKATIGPTITLYEITPGEGVRISKIRNLEDDIALSLSALGIRIIAPIPGKGTIGIEVPNQRKNTVSMESVLGVKRFKETKMDLPVALGKTITNEVFMVDLAKLPHLLVAGATGQGKSVGLNAIITSLLYKKHPNELKLVLIDPKKVEFSVYAPIADHFMAQVDDDDEPIITDVTKVVRTLKSLCTLMDHRYDLLKLAGARNIKEYNDKYLRHKLNPEHGHEFMPYIVVIIDEFGDLIMTAGKEVEMPIARIAQLARAVGIHMIIATQRPSSMMDSRIILDRPGANQLIGMGDMLYLNGNEPTRVQCAFINTPEIIQINEYIAKQSGPTSPMQLPEPKNDEAGDGASGSSSDIGAIDPLFEEAARSVIISQQGSTSMIQRRFSIGYNRAGRLMDQLEKAGIVGAAHGGKPRDVLIADENQLDNIIGQLKRM